MIGDLVYVEEHHHWGIGMITRLTPVEDTRSSTAWVARVQWFTYHPDRDTTKWINVDRLEIL